MGFFREGDPIQEEVSFYFAQWYKSMGTLDMLSRSIIELSTELVKYYTNYKKPGLATSDKKSSFNYFVRTWQDFYGYLINIPQTIYDYYDLNVRA